MSNKPDGVYSRKPWDKSPEAGNVAPRWSYAGPFASNEQRLVQQAMAPMLMTREQIMQQVKHPLPQIRHLPDRYGYDHTPLGIEDILSLDRTYVEPRVSWFSGGPGGYSGTSRNALG